MASMVTKVNTKQYSYFKEISSSVFATQVQQTIQEDHNQVNSDGEQNGGQDLQIQFCT